ncbi:MAG: HAD family hydrolase [Bacilli bacterium]
MKPYLIVLDLDGTLMLDFATYDDETFDYLRHLNQLGHLIMLATGRPKRSSYFVYKALNLHTPLINYNGAFISNPTDCNYPITDFRISKDNLLDIINYIRPYLINVFCEIIDDIYVQDYNEEIKPFLHIDGGVLHSGEIKDILPDNPNGALFFLKEAIIDFVDYIKKNYSNQLLARYWEVNNNYIVEVYNPLVNKSVGFKYACEYYNIPQERTIAIGDGHNDIELLKEAAIGVAMKNANPELLQYAKYVTDSYDKQGVLKFLKSFFIKKLQFKTHLVKNKFYFAVFL